MKTIKKTLNTDQTVNLYIFGDEHIGDPNCDIMYLAERIEQVNSDPNAVWIGVGDMLNNATIQSVSDTYAEIMSPMQELNLAIDMFKPIKDKCIGFSSGNHEDRTYKTDGIDLSQIVARELDAPYFDSSAVIFLRFGETNRGRPICYSIFARHGSGGGSSMGGKANKLKKNSEIVDADLYIQGHTHSPITYKEDFFRLSYPNSSVDKYTRTFVNIGSSLNYGGYGEKFGFAPSTKVHPIVHLNPHVKDIKVTI